MDPVKEIIGENAIERAIVDSPDLLGKECIGCLRVLPFNRFQRDASCRDGCRDLCDYCASVPRLSIDEHTSRLREMTNNSEAVKAQRMARQEEYKNDAARIGRMMHHSDLVTVLRQLIPSLYITDGNIVGDLAVFQTYGSPQPDLEGRTFRYLFYIPTGYLPEYSLYEFNDRDTPTRESQRGWRTVLLRLIKSGLLTEETVNHVFGAATGPASTIYNSTLYDFRNRREPLSALEG